MMILEENNMSISLEHLITLSSKELQKVYEEDPLWYYQSYVKASVSPKYDLKLAALGTAEELGEVAGVIMKMARYEDPSYFINKWGMSAKDKLKDELGDLLFQINNIANFAGLDMSDIMTNNLNKLDNRHSKDGVYSFGAGLGNTRKDGGTYLR
jgi:NTP pyrophosphatase (non-canonical NTP hydrolase)